MQRLTKRRSWLQAFNVIALVGFIAFVAIFSNTKSEPQKSSDAVMREVSNRYLAAKSKYPDVWWLEHASPEQGTSLERLLEGKKAYVLSLLERYKSVSPLTQKIADRFRELRITVAFQGGSFTVMKELKPFSPSETELCFIPKDQYTSTTPSSLFWRDDWMAVQVAAVEWPEIFLAGVLFHELGHGLIAHESGHEYQQGGPEDIAEEVAMHELELVVMNAASDGRYIQALDDIVVRHKSKDWKSLFAAVTLEDLNRLDVAIGADKFGRKTGASIYAQHLTAIGFRYIERQKLSEVDARSEKAAQYQWFGRFLE